MTDATTYDLIAELRARAGALENERDRARREIHRLRGGIETIAVLGTSPETLGLNTDAPVAEVLVTVSQAARNLLKAPRPAHWPPRIGDVWRDRQGRDWRAVDDEGDVALTRHEGEQNGEPVNAVDGPEWVDDEHGPLTLISRTANTATEGVDTHV